MDQEAKLRNELQSAWKRVRKTNFRGADYEDNLRELIECADEILSWRSIFDDDGDTPLTFTKRKAWE